MFYEYFLSTCGLCFDFFKGVEFIKFFYFMCFLLLFKEYLPLYLFMLLKNQGNVKHKEMLFNIVQVAQI